MQRACIYRKNTKGATKINSIKSRLERLEQYAPDSLTILAMVDDKEIECNVKDFLKLPNATFIKVLNGTDLADLDKLLDEWVGGLSG